MDHYVTLVSNASMEIFPENKLSSFRTRLPYVLDFTDGDWSVGLAEITYTKSWFNINEGHTMTPAYVESGTEVGMMQAALKTKITPGYYRTPNDFIAQLNKLLESWRKIYRVREIPILEVTDNQKLGVKQLGIHETSRAKREYGVLFDDKLNQLLGLMENRPIYLDQGMTSLYVYCDIVQPQVVGDSFEPLLRTIGVNNDIPFGHNVTEIFEAPYYLPLSRTSFQELTLDIRNDIGKPPSFNFGRVTVTLHFIKQ